MKVFYFSATKHKKEDTLLFNCNEGKSFFFKEDNTEALAVTYNKAIEFAIQENCDWLVLSHDDVIIDSDLHSKLLDYNAKGWQVLGVAGTSEVKLQPPVLWHMMGGGFQGGKLHGAVAHIHNNKRYMTGFGEYPKRCILIDGVFMAIEKSVFSKIKFNEECPAKWHFYDLNYCMECHKEGVKIGVTDISIAHASPGLSEVTQEFKDGEEWFLNKWQTKKD
jgi:GT2 family glycosyltransferase